MEILSGCHFFPKINYAVNNGSIHLNKEWLNEYAKDLDIIVSSLTIEDYKCICVHMKKNNVDKEFVKKLDTQIKKNKVSNDISIEYKEKIMSGKIPLPVTLERPLGKHNINKESSTQGWLYFTENNEDIHVMEISKNLADTISMDAEMDVLNVLFGAKVKFTN